MSPDRTRHRKFARVLAPNHKNRFPRHTHTHGTWSKQSGWHTRRNWLAAVRYGIEWFTMNHMNWDESVYVYRSYEYARIINKLIYYTHTHTESIVERDGRLCEVLWPPSPFAVHALRGVWVCASPIYTLSSDHELVMFSTMENVAFHYISTCPIPVRMIRLHSIHQI